MYTQASTDSQCWPIGGHESDQLVIDATAREGLHVLGWVHTHPQWEALTMKVHAYIHIHISIYIDICIYIHIHIYIYTNSSPTISILISI